MYSQTVQSHSRGGYGRPRLRDVTVLLGKQSSVTGSLVVVDLLDSQGDEIGMVTMVGMVDQWL